MIIYTINIIYFYSSALQSLKEFSCPLVRVSYLFVFNYTWFPPESEYSFKII